jgi:hypothetical protein
MLMRTKSSLERAWGTAQTLTVTSYGKPREGIGYENRCGGGAE